MGALTDNSSMLRFVWILMCLGCSYDDSRKSDELREYRARKRARRGGGGRGGLELLYAVNISPAAISRGFRGGPSFSATVPRPGLTVRSAASRLIISHLGEQYNSVWYISTLKWTGAARAESRTPLAILGSPHLESSRNDRNVVGGRGRLTGPLEVRSLCLTLRSQ